MRHQVGSGPVRAEGWPAERGIRGLRGGRTERRAGRRRPLPVRQYRRGGGIHAPLHTRWAFRMSLIYTQLYKLHQNCLHQNF